MLQDSLDRHANGETLTSHACAANIRYHLHFADAASITTGAPKDGGPAFWLVTVAEPSDSARIHHRALPLDTSAGRPEWAEAGAIYRKRRSEAFENALTIYRQFNDSAVTVWPTGFAQDSTDIRHVWHFLKTHQAPADERAAIEALRSASTLSDRAVAAGILLNFPRSDSAWAMLGQALLESDGPVQGLAYTVIRALVSDHQYSLSAIAALTPSLHAIFDGTSQFQIINAMRLVLAMHVDRTWAAPMLRHGGSLLVDYTSVQHAGIRLLAVNTLEALSGQDFGTDTARWRAWVNAL